MGKFLAGFLGLFGLGIIIYAALEKAALGGVRPSLAMVLVPILAFYSLGTWWHWRLKMGRVSQKAQRWGDVILHGLLFFIALGLLAAIPALWWGVIKKLAGMANEGGKYM